MDGGSITTGQIVQWLIAGIGILFTVILVPTIGVLIRNSYNNLIRENQSMKEELKKLWEEKIGKETCSQCKENKQDRERELNAKIEDAKNDRLEIKTGLSLLAKEFAEKSVQVVKAVEENTRVHQRRRWLR